MCMAKIETYRDLETWQRGIDFVEHCYVITRAFPSDERFGLTSQIRRAAVSIPSNVAEGSCRHTTSVYINHVSIALGSHGEIETCIEIACQLGYLSGPQKQKLMAECDTVGRLLNGLLRSLEAKLEKQRQANH
jgi:four helix bundle protein